MVFVFARNATVKSAIDLRDRARANNESEMFSAEENEEYEAAREEVHVLLLIRENEQHADIPERQP